jgi:hypothetical protein
MRVWSAFSLTVYEDGKNERCNVEATASRRKNAVIINTRKRRLCD